MITLIRKRDISSMYGMMGQGLRNQRTSRLPRTLSERIIKKQELWFGKAPFRIHAE